MSMKTACWPSTLRIVVASCAALLIAPTATYAQIDDPLGALKACARIQATADRVECYETLGRKALQTEAAAADGAAMPAAGGVPESTEPAEALAVPAVETEMPPPEPVKTAEAQAEPANTFPKMTDDLGGPEFRKRAGKTMPTFAGVVTSCRKDSYGKYYFYFDNDQIWKQSGGARLRYRECQFNVTVTKDFGGYVMRIEGRKGRVRIRRVD